MKGMPKPPRAGRKNYNVGMHHVASRGLWGGMTDTTPTRPYKRGAQTSKKQRGRRKAY